MQKRIADPPKQHWTPNVCFVDTHPTTATRREFVFYLIKLYLISSGIAVQAILVAKIILRILGS